jgi:hypothetical protein
MQSQVMSEEEFLSLSEKIGIFSFLHDPGEDIYDANDGECYISAKSGHMYVFFVDTSQVVPS